MLLLRDFNVKTFTIDPIELVIEMLALLNFPVEVMSYWSRAVDEVGLG